MKDSLVNQLLNSKGLIGLTSYRFNSDRLLRSNKKNDLVKEQQLTGKVGYVMTVAHTLLKHFFANVEVITP